MPRQKWTPLFDSLHPVDSEVEALVLYAGMSGGVTTTRYLLGQLSERRINL